MALNMRNLMTKISHNSPIRDPYSRSSPEVCWQKIGPELPISKSTFDRARRERENGLIFMKYHPQVTKQLLSPDRRSQVATFLDLEMPFVSGRNYRMQRGTFSFIYEKYMSYSRTTGSVPVALSYLHRVVHRDHVRKVNKMSSVPSAKV